MSGGRVKRHKCDCSDVLRDILNRPMSLPRVDKLNGNYMIYDPSALSVSDDIEITIMGLNSTWKIYRSNLSGGEGE